MAASEDRRSRLQRTGGRRLPTLLLILVGVACLSYGYGFHVVPVAEFSGEWSEEDLKTLEGETEAGEWVIGEGDVEADVSEKTQVIGESQLCLEVSRGGVEVDDEGVLRKTYGGKPPQACPT